MAAPNLIGFENIPQTIPHFCIESFRRNAKPDALSFKIDGAWKRLSGTEIIERIKRIALGLAALGIKPGDRVAIISENRPEWSLVDIALLSLRAVNVPIYTTQAVEQIRYILENSGAKMLFVSGKKLFKHAEEAIRSVEQLEKLVFFDEDGGLEGEARALTLAKIEEQGIEQDKIDPKAFEQALAAIEPGDLATIIYTSGTTGEPKGVMLTHENFVSNVVAISGGLPIRSTDRSLAVLPLSHIFERTVFYVLCSNGVAIHYCASFDQLASHLQEVKPTIMTAVPRLFEQVYHKIVKKGKSAGGWKTRLFDWALVVGQEYWEAKDKGLSVSPVLAAKHLIANRLVFSKWRAGVGGALRFFVSGGFVEVTPATCTVLVDAATPESDLSQAYYNRRMLEIRAFQPEDWELLLPLANQAVPFAPCMPALNTLTPAVPPLSFMKITSVFLAIPHSSSLASSWPTF